MKLLITQFSPTSRHFIPLRSKYSPQSMLTKIIVIYKNSIRTSQETFYVSATKPNRLMLLRGTVAVYCENRMEHTDTLCGQNA
jgi:hypothetical protein